jgi:hypothetical protein
MTPEFALYVRRTAGKRPGQPATFLTVDPRHTGTSSWSEAFDEAYMFEPRDLLALLDIFRGARNVAVRIWDGSTYHATLQERITEGHR